ncbi:MAG: ABC transporter substrate-binding protein [Anaerolineales bacterium]|nr:ABC transporter substrate-binding protein [Anaerolineales bacterium]
MRTEKTFTGKVLIFMISSMLLLTACSSGGEEPVQLRLALLPVLDTLPIHVALEEGLFDEQGIAVEVIPVSSAPERDQLIAAGKADGMLERNRLHPLL